MRQRCWGVRDNWSPVVRTQLPPKAGRRGSRCGRWPRTRVCKALHTGVGLTIRGANPALCLGITFVSIF